MGRLLESNPLKKTVQPSKSRLFLAFCSIPPIFRETDRAFFVPLIRIDFYVEHDDIYCDPPPERRLPKTGRAGIILSTGQ